jgi:hypothetical protein
VLLNANSIEEATNKISAENLLSTGKKNEILNIRIIGKNEKVYHPRTENHQLQRYNHDRFSLLIFSFEVFAK